MSIQINASRILIFLAGYHENDPSTKGYYSFDGRELTKHLGLSHYEINIAVQYLAEKGLLDIIYDRESAPYLFSHLEITIEGQILAESSLAQEVPAQYTLRDLLHAILPTDSDLQAFCLDHFRRVARRFGNGMDRLAKTNLLLEMENGSDIVEALQKYDPRRFSQNCHMLIMLNS